ncbi:DUF397 domain-containing protein [Streptodolium elevatio]|uniref:DUF397 domain-containing protein n=1 Tax=Streptodolium elevatio TaxID=3157996 RepID=A0ABV3DFF4_9ACTN
MAATEPPAAWRTSSYSGANGDCVEVGCEPSAALVRDSEQPASPHLRFSPDSWNAFLAHRAATA